MSILLTVLLIGAQAQTSSAADRAGKFALDLPATDTPAPATDPVPAADPTPAPTSDSVPPPPPVTASADAAKVTHFSLDTPIVELIADPRAKAVLDTDMPGLSTDENLSKFQALSLRKLAPLSGGQMTAELMGKLAYDLAALGGGAPPPRSRRGLASGR